MLKKRRVRPSQFHQWSRVLFTDESRFSATNYSERQLIWRDVGTRFHLSYIMEGDHFGGPGVVDCRGIIFKGGTSSTFSTDIL
ncbi:hypothetical protein TNCV_994541 [Trichonephila clavipes]|nr:hypothetical protein TNCV_994541 [Trichonephila clavipes]